MKTLWVRGLILGVIVLALSAPSRSVLAHGQPVIDVQPAMAPAGGEITITGMEMEPGEVFMITLESTTSTTVLGEATASGEGEDGGFTARFTIPTNVVPGSFKVRAETEAGEVAFSELTITGASTEASTGPAMAREPSGEEHVLDRSKPAGEVFGAVAIALASLGLGLWLILRRG